METGQISPPSMVVKKLGKIIRIVLCLLRKGLSKSKIMMDLHLLLKRGRLAGKTAITDLLQLHHNTSFSCHSAADVSRSFISPRDYEFSCSNSPAYPNFFFNKQQRKNNHRIPWKQYDDATVNAVQRVLEMLHNNNSSSSLENAMEVAPSPLVNLPGFGKSPLVRQLRITDSPFPLKEEGDSEVDKEAEEFIKRFYKDLTVQKRMTSDLESPGHQFWDR